jgi:hypothetical protein
VCTGGRCGTACSNEDHGRNRRPSAEDWGWSHRSGTQLSGDQKVGVAPCVVYTMHVKTRIMGFLVEPQNQGQWFVSGLATKPLGWFSPVWPQNRW